MDIALSLRPPATAASVLHSYGTAGTGRAPANAVVILPDVNVLVYAARCEAPHHEAVREGLTDSVDASEPLAVTDEALSASVRMLTDHKVTPRPRTPTEAVSFCAAIRRLPGVVPPVVTDRRRPTFEHLVTSRAPRRGGVPDALPAATALDLRAAFATFDRGLRRFLELTVVEPSA